MLKVRNHRDASLTSRTSVSLWALRTRTILPFHWDGPQSRYTMRYVLRTTGLGRRKISGEQIKCISREKADSSVVLEWLKKKQDDHVERGWKDDKPI